MLVASGRTLTGVSCPSASLCVAVDEGGDVWTNTSGGSGTWIPTETGSEHHFKAVSCASTSLCVAVDEAGDKAGEAFVSTHPTGGAGAWPGHLVDAERLTAVSCVSASLCVAVDAAGDALASDNPASGASSWTLTPIDSTEIKGISCASSGLCVATDASDNALASDDAGASVPEWRTMNVAPAPVALSGVSCLPSGFCIALDSAGAAFAARVPSPTATTLTPTEVASTNATLAGAVNPNDAALGECVFEYGTSTAYTQSAPCSSTPTATGGTQDVSAKVSTLEPNTTYHYRLVVSTPRGTRASADQTFTTAVSPEVMIVHPNPSISGTPAVGQKLTCQTGVSSGTSAKLSYAWLRDQIPIPESTASTYTVKGQDSGHHLQCQVTATDEGGSATAKSAFVTIPSGSGLTSAGETTIGKASVKGTRVSVPVVCSPLAGSSGCLISAHVTVVETFSGRRILAVAARAGRANDSATRTRQKTATLASRRTRVSAGASATVVVVLTRTGKRLLSARHGFSAALTVSGTVVGVIEAQLSQQTLALGRASGSAVARRATHSRSNRGASIRSAYAGGSPIHGVARTATRLRRTRAVSAHSAAVHVLAATPYMGWDTYFALGGTYSEATVLEQASQLISLGLEKRGYRYVWLDVGWWHGTRNAAGEIIVNAKQWPHGLAWLTRTLHAAGFLVGLYTDAGPNGCGGAGEGSYGHYQQDANTFAAWGFDAVKVDFCGGEEYHLNPQSAYSEFHAGLANNSSHRQMLLSICNFLQPEQYGEGRPLYGESVFSSYTFGPSVGNSWRTDTDVGAPAKVSFSDVLRNMDADAAAPLAAGPGHWNDPDYLAPDQGMSTSQFQTQLSMWAMLAAPLMISDDLTKIGPSSLATLTNNEVIAIDQDPAGVQGTLSSSAGNTQVWVKPLLGGVRAVALLNRGSSAKRIETSASAVGLAAAGHYTVRNVWTHTTYTSANPISAQVPGDSTVLLRITPA